MGITAPNTELSNMSLEEATSYKEEITTLMCFATEENLPQIVEALCELESYIGCFNREEVVLA